MENYYDILGISQSVNQREIKTRYRKLALKYHPDKNSSRRVEEKFKQITRAYNTLKNPESRKKYDRQLSSHTRIFYKEKQENNEPEDNFQSKKTNTYEQTFRGKDFVFYESFSSKHHLVYINLKNVFLIPAFSQTFLVYTIGSHYKVYTIFPNLLNFVFSFLFFSMSLASLLLLKLVVRLIKAYTGPKILKILYLICGLLVLNKVSMIYSKLFFYIVPDGIVNLIPLTCFFSLVVGFLVEQFKRTFDINHLGFTLVLSSLATMFLASLLVAPIFIFAQAFSLPSRLYYEFDLWYDLLKLSILGPVLGNLLAITLDMGSRKFKLGFKNPI